MTQSIDAERVPQPERYVGHSHFWQRAMARRQFVRVGAGASALALGAGLGLSVPALAAPASNSDPRPIPLGLKWGVLFGFTGDTKTYHTYYPTIGQEVSTIYDFHGVVAAAEVQGSGTGTNTRTKDTTTLYFDADMRFMRGTYIGMDGRAHERTVALI